LRINSKRTYVTLAVLLLTFFGVAFYTNSEATFIQESDQNSFDQLAYLDLALVTPSPTMDSSMTNSAFDKKVASFMKRWSIKGASVAVMNDNRLIYAKGYGHANLAKEEVMENYHLLRIASASKLITAIGIMKMVEIGQLSLDEKVFGSKGILTEYTEMKDQKHQEITVADLLNHRGGWSWRDGDFMFQPGKIKRIMKLEGSPSAHDIITFVLQNRRLRYKPGTQYAYSNFGYMLLGEIIERKTANTYERYIQTEILEPNGIKGMRLAGNYTWDRRPFEVHYYDYPSAYQYPSFDGNYEAISKPYGGNDLKTLGAAGGWIANASQLVKLASLIDPKSKYQKILSDESICLMTADDAYMSAYGWKGTRGEDWWRTGTLSGTSCFMYRKANGYTYAVILNSSVWMGHRFNKYIQHLMDGAIHLIDDEEKIDLMWQNRPEPSILPYVI
jgi:CubicO group peptidase (beta-lactamase class C family)